MKLVWLFDNPENLHEYEWIHDLVAPISSCITEVIESDRTTLHEQAVYIFNHVAHTIPYEEYFAKLQAAEIPFGAIHLSDETLGDTCNFYDFDMCKFVYRNYHHPIHCKNERVKVLGLGYKNGFRSAKSVYEPAPWYHWCFAGTFHSQDRVDAIRNFESLVPFLVVEGQGFGTGVDTETYKRMMELSKFAICLMGQCNVDTFRFYEALEANSIPVVLRKTSNQPYEPSYWHAVFPWETHFPFIMVDTWEEGVTRMRELLDTPITYLETRVQLQQFWARAKKIWSDMLTQDITSL